MLYRTCQRRQELGLYRKPGDSKAVNKILTRFGWEGRTPVFLDTDVHVLTVRGVLPPLAPRQPTSHAYTRSARATGWHRT